MKIIEHPIPKDYDINRDDYPWWGKYLLQVPEENRYPIKNRIPQSDYIDNKILPLYSFICMSPWEILEQFGLEDVQSLKDEVLYECPYSDLKYMGVVPYAILSQDIQKYRSESFSINVFDITWDDSWTRDMAGFKKCSLHTGDEYFGLPDMSVYDAQLGHGYDFCRLASDGSGSIVDAKAELDNGDLLIVKSWVWYNK